MDTILPDIDKYETKLDKHYAFMAEVETFMKDYTLDNVDILRSKLHMHSPEFYMKTETPDSNRDSHSFSPLPHTNHEDINRKFEKFSKYDISLKDTSPGSIALFYNDLRVIGEIYNIYFIAYEDIEYD